MAPWPLPHAPAWRGLYQGPPADWVYHPVGGPRAGMGYVGCNPTAELKQTSRFLRVTAAGQREGRIHDVIIAKEAPNYCLEP